jgi:hypothetical protein
MKEQTIYPRLIFSQELTEYNKFEAKSRGYLNFARVQISESHTYEIEFYDLVRFQQDVESDFISGEVCVANQKIVILPEVTLENMERAIRKLSAERYFDSLQPL